MVFRRDGLVCYLLPIACRHCVWLGNSNRFATVEQDGKIAIRDGETGEATKVMLTFNNGTSALFDATGMLVGGDDSAVETELAYVVEDAGVKMGPTFRLTGDAQKEARLALVNGSMPVYLAWLQKQLLAHGGEYFADNRLTVADLKVFVDVRGLNSGRLDHVPADLVEKVAPALNAHMQRIAQTPAVAQYYAKYGL